MGCGRVNSAEKGILRHGAISVGVLTGLDDVDLRLRSRRSVSRCISRNLIIGIPSGLEPLARPSKD